MVMAARQFQVIQHPLYLPDSMPANFFLFPREKRELAGKTPTKETLKKSGRGLLEPSPHQNSPQPSGGGMSPANSAAAVPEILKKTKCPNYNFFMGSSWFEGNTLRIFFQIHLSGSTVKIEQYPNNVS
jgi:hypothetical protein